MSAVFSTITADDWRRSLAAARAEGNVVLAQIRAAVAKKFPARPQPNQSQPHSAHADSEKQPGHQVIAPENNFAVAGSAARERSAAKRRAEAGDGDSFSS